MGSFKEMLENDITDVFLNPDEMADRHVVQGVAVDCLFDATQQPPTGPVADGYAVDTRMLCIAVKDWPGTPPMVNREITVDGRRWLIRRVSDAGGMYVLAVESATS